MEKNKASKIILKSSRTSFRSRGFKVNTSKSLDCNAINIIIDEFTNFLTNLQIKEFSINHPNSPIIVVSTEFIERKHFVSSFNHFGSILESAFLAWVDLALRSQRKDFLSSSLMQWLRGITLLPLLPLFAASLILFSPRFGKSLRRRNNFRPSGFKARLHHLIYMHMRYLGFQSMIKYADAIILSHDFIGPGLEAFSRRNKVPVLGTFFPECAGEGIDSEMLSSKDLCIEITGSVTSYRARQLNKIARDTTIFGMHHLFASPRKRSFGDSKETKRAAFSLHPPQAKNWKYASPTRIFRALFIDKNIPIITKNFKQHPIEEVCLIYQGGMTLFEMTQIYQSPEKLKNHIETKIKPYLAIASQKNDSLVERVKSLPILTDFNKHA